MKPIAIISLDIPFSTSLLLRLVARASGVHTLAAGACVDTHVVVAASKAWGQLWTLWQLQDPDCWHTLLCLLHLTKDAWQ